MEHLGFAIEDPLIKGFLCRFPRKEWEDVIRETLKLGIHSMNTLQSLSFINNSPEKCWKNLDGGLEDDSTLRLADSVLKNEGTTPSSKECTKILKNDLKVTKKKKAQSQVNKAKVSRVTPKAKRIGFEMFLERKETKRVHSVKNKGKGEKNCKEKENLCEGRKKTERVDVNCAKSFKNLKNKALDLQLSPHVNKLSPKYVKNSLGMNDFNEFYRNNMSCRIQQVEFPLKMQKNFDMDPFVYVTSSSEESFS